MKQQQGIALITILVMVALATILAATIAKRQYHTFDNTAYLMRQNQALQYAKSAESFFSELLLQDSQNSGTADYLQETWAQPMPPFPVEDGMVSGRLEDESGKFNLNSLLKADAKPNEKTQKLFENLLQRVGLSASLSQAVMDWQDPDDLASGSMGAESQYYQGLPNGYLAANRPFNHIEELRLVRGFEGKNYDLIAPYISALPDIATKINMNTAPAMVLASLHENINVDAVRSEIEAKQKKMEYFKNTNELMALAPFAQIDPAAKSMVNDLFDVKSAFFKADIEVLLSNRKRQLSSHFMRKNNQVYVYSRSLAPF